MPFVARLTPWMLRSWGGHSGDTERAEAGVTGTGVTRRMTTSGAAPRGPRAATRTSTACSASGRSWSARIVLCWNIWHYDTGLGRVLSFNNRITNCSQSHEFIQILEYADYNKAYCTKYYPRALYAMRRWSRMDPSSAMCFNNPRWSQSLSGMLFDMSREARVGGGQRCWLITHYSKHQRYLWFIIVKT